MVSDAPQTDTTREKNLELVIEWVKKSPPEIIPHLMSLAFELSNIPNKDQLLARLRPILGMPADIEDLTAEQIKEKTLAELEAQKEQQAKDRQLLEAKVSLEIEEQRLKNEKLEAETAQILSDIDVSRVKPLLQKKKDEDKIDLEYDKLDVEGVKVGLDLVDKISREAQA